MNNKVVIKTREERRQDEKTRQIEQLKKETETLYWQLMNGRAYLMEIEADKITVEDTLEAFGFGRNGLKVPN